MNYAEICIIKRDGKREDFSISKIKNAIGKAFHASGIDNEDKLIAEITMRVISNFVSPTISVEEIQDMVENKLMDMKAHDIARHYITYRYVQSLKRQTNTTDERILSLIECQNEEVKQENANKNPTVNSVQRDYMAGDCPPAAGPGDRQGPSGGPDPLPRFRLLCPAHAQLRPGQP